MSNQVNKKAECQRHWDQTVHVTNLLDENRRLRKEINHLKDYALSKNDFIYYCEKEHEVHRDSFKLHNDSYCDKCEDYVTVKAVFKQSAICKLEGLNNE